MQNKKKRVFHIVSHFDVGGAERVAVNIAKSQTEGSRLQKCSPTGYANQPAH